MMTDLRTVPFDAEYAPGARNAVEVCLRIQPSEKVTVLLKKYMAKFEQPAAPMVPAVPAEATETPRRA